jgi:hypothetical protein
LDAYMRGWKRGVLGTPVGSELERGPGAHARAAAVKRGYADAAKAMKAAEAEEDARLAALEDE